jgi:ubiquinone/menaquinone biosynthesis C-methylase UbiE
VTDHFIDIYQSRAEAYQRMIAAEDVEGNLLRALEAVTPFEGKRVLDVGSGTGRLPQLLARKAEVMVGVDLHRAMLVESGRERERLGAHWELVQADARALPVASGWAGVVMAGWAMGHFNSWFGAGWRKQIDRALAEMQRAAAPDGVLVIMETLGTGQLQPGAPTEALRRYHDYLETAWGFRRQEIATDYQFDSVDEAVACTEFFFGPELAQKIREKGWARVPEWTGVWSVPVRDIERYQ